MSQKSIEELTGLGGNKRSVTLDKVALNGNTGEIILHKYTEERDENGKVATEIIGSDKKPLRFNLLRQRFKLSKYVEGKNGLMGDSFNSTEYDRKSEMITLYQGKMKMRGVAEELKKTHDLSTVTVVYAMLPDYDNKIVRLEIKGLSYGGSDNYPKDRLGWFDFLKKLSGANLKAHEFIIQADVLDVPKTPKTSFAALAFKRSKQMDSAELANAEAAIIALAEQISAGAVQEQTETKARPEQDDNGFKGAFENKHVEEINPDDIPF